MRVVFLAIVAITTLQGALFAQTSAAAERQAQSHFKSSFDALMDNSKDVIPSIDLDLQEAAVKKSGISTDRRFLLINIPRFRPLRDATARRVPEASAKFSARFAQIPIAALQQWAGMSGTDEVFAGMSLAAEDSVFPQEKFSEKGFQSLVAKFK